MCLINILDILHNNTIKSELLKCRMGLYPFYKNRRKLLIKVKYVIKSFSGVMILKTLFYTSIAKYLSTHPFNMTTHPPFYLTHKSTSMSDFFAVRNFHNWKLKKNTEICGIYFCDSCPKINFSEFIFLILQKFLTLIR